MIKNSIRLLKRILFIILFIGAVLWLNCDKADDAQARKEKSIAFLKINNIPYDQNLPVIKDVSGLILRTKEAVCLRALALCFVSTRADGMEKSAADSYIQKYDLQNSLSPMESYFLKDPNPPENVTAELSWRFEALYMILWALGYVNNPGLPNAICDAEKTANIILAKDRAGFIKNANLRSLKEILDQVDLYYRFQWAVKDAETKKQPLVKALDAEIIYERLYALKWIVQYESSEWDDVNTEM